MALISSDHERRQHPRYNKKISVHIKDRSHKVSGKLKKEVSGDNSSSETMGRDISRGGLRFYSDAAYEPDALLTMTIRIADIKDEAGHTPMYLMSSTIPVRAVVRVVWCRPTDNDKGYEVGVAFVDLYGDDYKILQKNLPD